MNSRWVKWIPAAAMPAVIAGVVIAGPLQAAPSTDLPDKTPEQVIAMVAASRVTAFSGTIKQGVALGLPELPATGPSNASSGSDGLGQLVEMLSQDHAARVYADGATKQRIQVLDVMAERNVVRNGSTIWTYDSSANEATKITLPEHPAGITDIPAAPVMSPADLATKLLVALDPSTTVSVGPETSIANRAAYVLALTPRTPDTLVGTISVAVDAQTGIPLSVAVYPQGSDTVAFHVQFTQLDLKAPPASVFAFTPPAGATMSEHGIPAPDAATHNPSTTPPSSSQLGESDNPQVKVSGTGWAVIAETPAGTVPAEQLANPALQEILHQVDGGQALETTLFSILITPDGRVFSGAVPVAALQAAAAGQ